MTNSDYMNTQKVILSIPIKSIPFNSVHVNLDLVTHWV